MQAHYVAAVTLETLLDSQASVWSQHRSETISLMGTPAGLQPTAAIRAAWTGKPIGAVEQVAVTALHNAEVLAFRLEWADDTENSSLPDNTSFADAAAIALPVAPDSPLMTMGAPGKAVNAWYWHADDGKDGARQISSEGLGTTRTLDRSLVRVSGTWKEGHWRVVISRTLQAPADSASVQLAPGASTGFGVAIWEGSHQERGGIKAFSGDWISLELEALPSGGKS